MSFYDIAESALAILSSLSLTIIILGCLALALHPDTLKG